MPPPTIGALLDEIEANDQRATYAVLADALVEAGDARGELMQVQLALDAPDEGALPPHLRALPRPASAEPSAALDPATRRQLRGRLRSLRKARATALLGPLAKRREIELSYRYGLLARVKLEATRGLPPEAIASTVATIFRSSEARLLRSIELAPGPDGSHSLVRTVVDELLDRAIAPPPARAPSSSATGPPRTSTSPTTTVASPTPTTSRGSSMHFPRSASCGSTSARPSSRSPRSPRSSSVTSRSRRRSPTTTSSMRSRAPPSPACSRAWCGPARPTTSTGVAR